MFICTCKHISVYTHTDYYGGRRKKADQDQGSRQGREYGKIKDLHKETSRGDGYVHYLDQELSFFAVKGKIVNILGIEGHMVSVTTT